MKRKQNDAAVGVKEKEKVPTKKKERENTGPKKAQPQSEVAFIDQEVARSRWSLLARKLRFCGSHFPKQSPLRLFSTRLISCHEEGSWFSCSIDDVTIQLFFPLIKYNPHHLMGFDNTGNVKIWPGGESLAAYILNFPDMVKKKAVLELGSGLVGLPSMISSLLAKKVTVTDGNEKSVDNLRIIIDRLSNVNIETKQLIWNSEKSGVYDVILAADCVFFEQSHISLLDCIYGNLVPGGIACICSPPRKNSLKRFLDNVQQDGRFSIEKSEDFLKFLDPFVSPNLDRDLDVPELWILNKI